MIQSIADKYKKHIAYPLFFLFYFESILMPLHAAVNHSRTQTVLTGSNSIALFNQKQSATKVVYENRGNELSSGMVKKSHSPEKLFIGGPTSPEASSFKAVGSDNLVNLFTGDFNYSIPLLDVGGYPVNLFYTGGVTMEQEASWVGLGWNINPGTVNRNMRGVPDDFNGDDELIQTQNVKPNRTWGGEVGVDGELLGIKKPNVNFTLGFSVNNYLGPALELGAGISLGIPLLESIKSEKAVGSDALGAGIGLNTKLSSRSGLTFSPSLNLNLPLGDNKSNIGAGVSTSYNSRTGIKELNISSQVSFNRYQEKSKGIPDNNNQVSISSSIGSSSISFARPSYMPTLRMPMEYSNTSGQLEFGFGMYGVRASVHGQGYYSESTVPVESRVVSKPLIGFMYSEKASSNKDAVMDLTRLNDAEVTPNTPVISAPQYAYDIFSIQGEGTGGTIRAYRGDLGYMRDNETTSKDKNFSIGADIAPPGHYGGNWNIIKTPTRVGGWEDANNTLRQTMSFLPMKFNNTFENIYFRNPGEVTVSNPQLLNRVGRDNLVRFKLSGSDVNPRLESVLEQFNKNTLSTKADLPLGDLIPERDKRTQVTTMLTADEASAIGLEKQIRNYSGAFDTANNIQFSTINRKGDIRKGHHISEINVLEQSGMRYVYGVPVYSVLQKDFTFSVENTADPATGIVSFSSNEPTIQSLHMADKSKMDGYVMTQQTPAYASSFLLTGLLSPDYVDVRNDGITEDDLGGAVKFNYKKSESIHKWRTPRGGQQGNTAHINEGLKSEKKDNKATISYGEREVWYLNAIESKSMIALFKTASRNDAKGVVGESNGTINQNEDANKRLIQIDLYTKSEIKQKGITNARPIKTVHFDYDYSLCPGTPDNSSGGKLTLKAIYFTYNGQNRLSKNKYVFDYGNTGIESDNPTYKKNASDKWGTYKNPDTNLGTNAAANPAGLYNQDYPYTSQNKPKNDEFAAAWSLKKILLPSGGQMEVQYEADDYAYVQNRRACDMFSIYGIGNSTTASTDNGLYQLNSSRADNNYIYIQLPQPLQGTTSAAQKKEIFDKYLQSLNQLAFKLLINMPKGPEALTVYANYDDYGLCANSVNKDIIYLQLRTVDNKSPLVKSAIGFITENLPGQAFEGYEIESSGIKAFLDMMGSMIGSIKDAFKNVDEQMRGAAKARTVVLNKSFVRLANPSKIKYGGGIRVKRILVKDNWNKMKGTFVSTYGQDYDYTTTEIINGTETAISSGVASYEPGIGSEENPFREILSFSNKLPMASAQYGAIEMPMLEGMYPSPVVGYSKVTVRSIHRKGTHGDSAVRSAIGKQVTEFYTAKEYPTYSSYTPISAREYHYNSFFNILYKQINDRKVLSQGFLVETNDMHGKIRSQKAFSESDEKTPLSYSYHTYKNTGRNGLNDVVDFIRNDQGGEVTAGNIGIDVELMTDVREFKAETNGFNGQIQTDFFSFLPPIFVVPMLPIKSYTENKYRAVTTTKLINYHAIEDSVIVMDKGSVISTKTVAFDAETGTPVVTRTANEFKDPVFNINYPAYWAYSGMSPAYKNIGREFSGVTFINGKIQGTSIAQNETFESGDELWLMEADNGSPTCVSESMNVTKLWAYDKNKNETALTVVNKDLIFIDSAGNPYTKTGVRFKIIRSGKRNLLTSTVASVTAMTNPIVAGKLTINPNSKAVAASAMEFREKWQADKDVINRYSLSTPAIINLISNGDFQGGNTISNTDYSAYHTSYTSGHEFTYTINTNAQNSNPGFGSCTDHTSGSGNMMIVNGSTQSGKRIWYNTVAVLPNTNYDLSVWMQSVASGSPANLSFSINNVEIGTYQLTSATCSWKNFSKIWNSGSSSSAYITIVDLNTELVGNDLALDDIFFGISSCFPQEVADCNGYLEKKINPYVKGLIGNFKDHRSLVFYGNRNEQSTAPNSTAIRTNGYLSDFTQYWNFNTANNLVPEVTNTKWVWNSENLKYNSKGLQLENKDALNIYTSAQYGFNKTQPVAVAKNSRFHQMFGEGFEDYNYNERIISGVLASCSINRHIDFNNLSGSSIVNTDTLNFNAHTGKNVLRVNNIVEKTIPVIENVLDSFNLLFKTANKGDVNELGGNIEINNPDQQFTITPNFTNGINVEFEAQIPASQGYAEASAQSLQYIKVVNKAVYTFEAGIHEIPHGGEITYDHSLQVALKDLDDNIIASGSQGFAIELCPGIYKMESLSTFRVWISGNLPFNGVRSEFWFNSLNGLATYKSLTECIYTSPIAATDSMLNPNFTLIPGKKMLFSAWVREACSIPCAKLSYSDNKVELDFGTGQPVSINPSGTIIEGWQKVEGEFEVPANAASMMLRFVNTGTAESFWDDIRIHPFNANMKTYTYDARTLRLAAELDENNYASFYEYDEEGQLVRVKKETSQGIKTINETRSAKQKIITELQ